MNAAFHVDFTLILCFVYCQDHLSICTLQQRITEYKYGGLTETEYRKIISNIVLTLSVLAIWR